MDHCTIDLVPPPASLAEMVGEAQAIVIGTVLSIDGEAEEGPYSTSGPEDSDARRVTTPEGLVIDLPGVHVTYYTVSVERILSGDDRLEEGGQFLLRLSGSAAGNTSPCNAVRMPAAGDRRLFVLGMNPDLQSYGIASLWGQIRLDGAQPEFADWARTPVPFAEGYSPEAFLALLEAAISEG